MGLPTCRPLLVGLGRFRRRFGRERQRPRDRRRRRRRLGARRALGVCDRRDRLRRARVDNDRRRGRDAPLEAELAGGGRARGGRLRTATIGERLGVRAGTDHERVERREEEGLPSQHREPFARSARRRQPSGCLRAHLATRPRFTTCAPLCCPFCRGPLVVVCGLCGLRAQLQQVSPLGVLEHQFVQGCTGAPRNFNQMTHELRIDPTSPDLRALTFVSTLRSFNNVTLHERIGLDETKTVDPNFFLGMEVRNDVSPPQDWRLSQLRVTATTPRSPRGTARRRAAARARTAATGSSTSTTSGTTPRRPRRSGGRPRRRTPCRPASRAPATSRTPRSTTTTRGATTARLRATSASEGSGTRGRRPARARRLRAR